MFSVFEASDVFNQIHGRFFDQDIKSLQAKLQMHVQEVSENIKKANNIKDDWTFDLENSDIQNVLVYGRIYSGYQEDNPTEHFDISNAFLHFTSDFNLDYIQIIVQNNDICPGLFKGQIVVVRGTINNGCLLPVNVYTDSRCEIPNKFNDDLQCKVVVAAGPYFTDNLEKVVELNSKIKSYKPDLIILLGPFVTSDSSLLMKQDCQYTAVELTQKVIDLLIDGCENKLILIPSIDDAIALPVLPHPAISQYKGKGNVYGDPAFIKLKDQVEILATAYDIPFAINQNYDGDRTLRRINVARQIAHQNSACPAMTPDVQIQYLSSLVPKVTPNIILTGTRLFSLHETFEGTNVIYVLQYIRSGILTVIDINGNEVKSTFTSEFNIDI